MSTNGTGSIGPKQTARVFHAVRFANDNGRALNLLITIDFTSLGVSEQEVGKLFSNIWVRVGRWWAYQRKKGRSFGPFTATPSTRTPKAARGTFIGSCGLPKAGARSWSVSSEREWRR